VRALNEPTEKPKRLNFQTYLQLVKNSPGTKMFRNFYVRTAEQGEFDALDNGQNSCAFFVSSVLVIFNKLERIPGTVAQIVKDMEASGWEEVKKLKTGDVIVWENKKFHDGWHEHIGFYVGSDRAISTSSHKKIVAEHNLHFGKTNRPIKQILRTNWRSLN
jgi:hypothetical protein